MTLWHRGSQSSKALQRGPADLLLGVTSVGFLPHRFSANRSPRTPPLVYTSISLSLSGSHSLLQTKICEIVCIGKLTRRGHSACAKKKTINLERGSIADVEESVVNAAVPSVSVTWMTNQNRCDTTLVRFSAHQGWVCFHPSSTLAHHNK